MNKADKFKLYISVGIFILFVISIVWVLTEAVLDKYYLSKEYKYTVMTSIHNGSADGKGHSHRAYNFIVNSKKYSGETRSDFNTDKLYFVKFYPPDPSKNEAVYIQTTDYDIQNLPLDGYKELPHH